MSPAATLKLDTTGLSAEICKGVAEGNANLLAGIIANSSKNHNLRNDVQTNSDKIWEVDGEVKLIKGSMLSLVGQGDGSTGLVPRMEADVKTLSNDVAGLKSDVKSIMNGMEEMAANIKAIRTEQGVSKTFMDGWKGVAIALGIVGTCLTVMGVALSAAFWLFTHAGGVK